jgi:hypothetical protein
MTLEISALEIIVGILVIIAVTVIWVINKKRPPDKKKINVDAGLLALVLTIAAALVLMLVKSDFFKNSPILIFITVLCLITGVTGITDTFATLKSRKDLGMVLAKLQDQVSGMGNLIFYPTKEETFKMLCTMTRQAKEKVMSTRFSSGDISTESDYWCEVKHKAISPSVMCTRVHCLAHKSSKCIDGVCRIVNDFCGAKQFLLGITFQNNEFEMIITDDRECMICFHDLEMTIRNGFKVDASLPNSAGMVSNFGDTYRRILNSCYVVIDFEKFVRNTDDIRSVQNFLRAKHKEYCDGKLPKPVHPDELEKLIASYR